MPPDTIPLDINPHNTTPSQQNTIVSQHHHDTTSSSQNGITTQHHHVTTPSQQKDITTTLCPIHKKKH